MARVWHRRALAALATAGVALGLLTTTATAAPAPTLTFAAFNICKSQCAAPAPSWDVRRDRVARVINESGADVVGLNEATNWAVSGETQIRTSSGSTRSIPRTQWLDVRELTEPAGYVAPNQTAGPCTKNGCTHSARLLYKTRTVRQLPDFGDLPSAGDAVLSDITGPDAPIGASRQMAWAYLQGVNGTGPFLAISAHLDTDKSALGEQSRVAFAKGLDAWIAAMNAPRGLDASLPVVLVGDLNSFDARQPNGVQALLKKSGWTDAWSAPTRKNIDINTVNYSDTQRSGWPRKPIRNASGVASRIDYILFRGPGLKAVSYEVVVRLAASGAFNPDYQASDHNLVRAVIRF